MTTTIQPARRSRPPLPAFLARFARELSGGRCAMCGTIRQPREVAHIRNWPTNMAEYGGITGDWLRAEFHHPGNVIYLCSNKSATTPGCHQKYDDHHTITEEQIRARQADLHREAAVDGRMEMWLNDHLAHHTRAHGHDLNHALFFMSHIRAGAQETGETFDPYLLPERPCPAACRNHFWIDIDGGELDPFRRCK
ncbi:hypothetical protein ACFWEB_17330 [Streptomyces parvus]|uniref:hypothetical protein n=1 Tax=Streptomyces parvus TaxID=66428 RepID=UPI00364CF359